MTAGTVKPNGQIMKSTLNIPANSIIDGGWLGCEALTFSGSTYREEPQNENTLTEGDI